MRIREMGKLDVVIAWHEKQAEYFSPFGPKNELTKFHSEAAAAIELVAQVAEAMGPFLAAMNAKYPDRLTNITERGKAMTALEAAYHKYKAMED